jgi:hypothetical protein
LLGGRPYLSVNYRPNGKAQFLYNVTDSRSDVIPFCPHEEERTHTQANITGHLSYMRSAAAEPSIPASLTVSA